MTTVVNSSTPSTDNGNSAGGTLLALALVLLIAILFFVYGLPAMRQATTNTTAETNTNNYELTATTAPQSPYPTTMTQSPIPQNPQNQIQIIQPQVYTSPASQTTIAPTPLIQPTESL